MRPYDGFSMHYLTFSHARREVSLGYSYFIQLFRNLSLASLHYYDATKKWAFCTFLMPLPNLISVFRDWGD